MSVDDNHTPRRSSASPQSVLVVEDEVLIRLVIAEYLRECGFKVHEASNAHEAIIVLEKSDIPVDVVFSDIEMPGAMDGFALSKWIRQHRPELGVILAGTPARAAEAAGTLCENGPKLQKPYEPQAVLDQIRRLLAMRGQQLPNV